MPLSAGARLGPYEITSTLGSGGMGEVYRARDTRLNRDVAIKVLPVSLDRDPALRARFEREAQALAALNHPHIAAIYDVIDVADHRAIVMELVSGSTLAEAIESGPLSVRDAIRYGINISDALSVAHAAGIVHRDLKPSNIVITENGFAKVLDFGIAKRTAVSESALAGAETTAVLRGVGAVRGSHIGGSVNGEALHPSYRHDDEDAHARAESARHDERSLLVLSVELRLLVRREVLLAPS
jgi:serine/threonine protein kinase